MKLANTGLVQNYCLPNALLTFKEYLLDFASEKTRKVGERLIKANLEEMEKKDPARKSFVEEKLQLIEQGSRDLYI